MTTPPTNHAPCRLCLKIRPLLDSHAVPAFVFRWLIETSGTGYLRFSDAPNRREQDGWKRRWLCGECEGKLGRLEKDFAEQLFRPLVEEVHAPYPYGPWLAPGLASIVWRGVMIMAEKPTAFNFATPEQRALIPAGQESWRAFAAGEVADPGIHELHFLPMGLIDRCGDSGALPPYFNRYMTRIVEVHAAGHALGGMFVMAKMGPAIALGFIQPPPSGQWEGTRVSPGSGFVGGAMGMPTMFLNYLTERADKAHALATTLSERQGRRIDEAASRNLDRVARSESFKALDADVRLFGRERVWGSERGDDQRRDPE